jgi:methionyl-tRNA formyltransferase
VKPLDWNRHVPISTDQPLRVALFLGSDITSHMIANRVIPNLLDSGLQVQLFLTRGSSSASRPLPLRQLFFVEHTLLQEFAYPYVDAHGIPQPGRCNTPGGWRVLAPDHVTVSEVEKVNDPEFVTGLKRKRIDIAFSVRCYQKFRQPILETLGNPESGSLFVNLHPGLLPHYRGVNTFTWSMLEDASEIGFTLHHLTPDWDTGDIIGQARFPVSYSRSVHENMLTHTADAAGLILDLIRRVAAGQPVRSCPQDGSQARYFSYPGEPEIARLASRGIDVFRASAVVDLLVDAFYESVPDAAHFRKTLIDAVSAADVPCEYADVRRQALSRAGGGDR